MSGLDPEGIDLVDGDRFLRIFFPVPLTVPRDAHVRLVEMAKEARAALGE
jgi:putative heme iron utilization protein